MSKIIVLFNLQSGVDYSAYENWARSTDLPIVNSLSSIDEFEIYKANGMLGSEDASPYQYVELLSVNDLDKFGEEVASETMKKVASEFLGFADSPMFITLKSI